MKIFDPKNLRPMLPFLAFAGLMLGVFFWANGTGNGLWNRLTDNSEKWKPDGKSAPSGSGHTSTFYHK